MKKNTWTVVLASLVALAAFTAVASDKSERKIVVFDKGHYSQSEKILRMHNGVSVKDLNIVNGKVANLSKKDAEALKNEPGVLSVEDDAIVTTQALRAAALQVLPWGIDRVDAENVWSLGNTGDTVKVGVIDTGISSSHPELKANIKGGYNAINRKKSWNDDNGHGSHVAGIIAAINDAYGVVGAAPFADLYAIKVLNANGSGYISDVIEGIDWARTNGMNVINLSLGSTSDISAMHTAVTNAYNAGVVIVAAAGNSGGSVIYPAAYPEVIAVSATDQNNILAGWSSRGPEVDIAAPGVGIYSTYKGTGYATLSGTSMATPHVTGSVALVLSSLVGVNDANANGKWDPEEVKTKIQSTALDLGDAGFDSLYGWGLMNAFAAVQ
ncbi:S8 family serine peptidase [Candidatus Giovannonibacteria bacterium]|nr:S8 family serine peptidase [Candidatus Giovannonibacteria bacterium]